MSYPPQQQPPVMHGYPTPAAWSPPPARRQTSGLAWVAGILTVLALASWGGYASWLYANRSDTGVEACKELRDGKLPKDGKGTSEQKFREVREMFASSNDAELRKHGVTMMDLAWKVGQMKDPNKEAWPYLPQLMEATTGLRVACATHDVVLPST